ncbi:hypothetical protein [Arthrobacter sp. QXT-31]|uniref:hypothetical protein n=1 Tax=Arthrobacter sp. QXT-31 TaxID=1357915 RepID=UPI001F341AED|nr:hypothetical protein [Arthrobacter sp. QXT-31]
MTLDIESSTVVGVAHPLDPLSREEISRAVGILKAGPAAAESFRFISVELREPSKADLRNGVQVVREADAVLVDRAVARSYEAVVNLETGTVDAWKQLARMSSRRSCLMSSPSARKRAGRTRTLSPPWPSGA